MIRQLGLWLCLPTALSAAELHLSGPEQAELASPISLYSADAPYGEILATLAAGETIEIAPGRYVFGLGALDWRSEPQVVDEHDHEIRLGALALAAPGEAEGEFAVFGGHQNRLLGKVDVNVPMMLPAGEFVLRRDLSEETVKVRVNEGKTSTLELSTLKLDASALPAGQPVFVANSQTREIGAVLSAGTELSAHFPGHYLVATTDAAPLFEVLLESGSTTQLDLGWVEWRDQAEERDVFIDGARSPLSASTDFALRLNDEEHTLTIGSDKVALDVSAGHATPVWRYGDGSLSLIVGLNVSLSPDTPQSILPGGALPLVVPALDDVRVNASLVVSEQVYELEEVQLTAGDSLVYIDIPDDIDTTGTATVLLHHPSNQLSGRLVDLPVQKPLAEAVLGAVAVARMPTVIELRWQNPEEPGLEGVRVFRGDDGRAITGARPHSASEFLDIGLSANKTYSYRICTVDQFDRLGPCVGIEATTPK